MNERIKKNGLIYSSDFKTIYGIDTGSSEFTGTVPYGAQIVAEDAFSCCSLVEISLPESVQEVGANLFCNSKSLERVKLPRGLARLSPFMFCGCSSLRRVEMPLSVEDFSEGLFAECSALEEIPFRVGIKTLPEGVFSGCASLKSLVIPGTVKKICTQSICDCTELKTIVLPDELSEFEDDAITNCPSLARIRISDANERFYTDEEGTSLFRRRSDGGGTLVFELEKRAAAPVPTVNVVDENQNPSIIDYSDDEDSIDEDLDIFSAGQKSVIINGDDALQTARACVDVDERNVDGITPLLSEPKNEGVNMDSDMERRLSEIMSQEYKKYGDEDFNIMSIPEATEDEIEASRLAPTAAAEDFVPTIEIHRPVVHEAPAESEESMADRISEIMRQETSEFSISAIPEASAADIEANRLVAEGDFAAGVENPDSAVPEIPDAEYSSSRKNYDDDERSVMQNMVSESDKVEQINLIPDADEQKILFVFAENLAQGPIGKIFSKRLVKCANRLAEIHRYTSIYMFSGINLENEDFKAQFSRYMSDKSVVIACSGGTLGTVGERTVEFASLVGVPLEKDSLDEQVRLARSPDAVRLKLLIQDNLND